MSDTSIFVKGEGKTWLANALKTHLEQLGFTVSRVTEGTTSNVFTVREPMDTISREPGLRAEDRQAMPVGIERIRKPVPVVTVRLPGAIRAVEIVGVLDTPLKVDSLMIKGPDSFKWPDTFLTEEVHSRQQFNEQYLLKPTPEPHPDYITVTSGMRGFFAVHMKWCSEYGGFYEPYQSSDWSHKTSAEAILDAKEWAESEGVVYR